MSTSSKTANILVTGANGFVAQNLIPALKEAGYGVIGAVRRSENSHFVSVGAINGNTNWERALIGVDTVIHLASRVHQMKEIQSQLDSVYKETNVDGTLKLAQMAIDAGVKQFIFLSSIKVNGEQTSARPFSIDDEPSPQDAYGRSKLEAEYKLRNLCAGSSMNLIIIRPSLIYGPGVKGNFFRLLKSVYRCLPIPLKEVNNKRSLLSVFYLNDFILKVLKTPDVWNETYLLCDPTPMSTPQLIRLMAKSLKKRDPLVPFPLKWLQIIAKVFGKLPQFNRITGSLEVDASKAHSLVKPRFTTEQVMYKTGEWFRSHMLNASKSKKA